MKLTNFCCIVYFLLFAQNVFSYDYYDNNRVYSLEKKVDSLNSKIDKLKRKLANFELKLEYLESSSSLGSKNSDSQLYLWSCDLKVVTDIYSGQGFSKVEATGKTLQDCGESFHCKKEEVKCHKTDVKVRILPDNKKKWACYVQKTLGNKTFVAYGETEKEAGVKVIKDCDSMFCKKDKLVCGMAF